METVEVLHKKKLLTPKFRFKEFNDAWKSCTLNDVTQYTKGFAFKSDHYKDKGTRIIRVSDLGADRIKTKNEKIFIATENSNLYEKYKLISGNIIITTVGSKPEMLESAVGRGIFIKKNGEGLLNQNLLKFENIKGVDNGFLMGLINSKKYQLHIKGIARGNANQANITVVDLLQFRVVIPTFPEQQKIASFLSVVDEKIQQLIRKKELLEQFKKGVMQQLFSGKLRFKDENGKGFTKWEDKTLFDISENVSYGLNAAAKEFDGVHKYIRITDIDVDSGKFIPNPLTSPEGQIDGKFRLHENDIVFARTGASVGKSYLYNKDDGELYYAGFLIKFSIVKANSYFVYSLTLREAYYKWVHVYSMRSGQPGLNAEEYKALKFKLPSLPEQNKIANYLSSIDNKIDNVNKQITLTQTFKKGLLQQMFV